MLESAAERFRQDRYFTALGEVIQEREANASAQETKNDKAEKKQTNDSPTFPAPYDVGSGEVNEAIQSHRRAVLETAIPADAEATSEKLDDMWGKLLEDMLVSLRRSFSEGAAENIENKLILKRWSKSSKNGRRQRA